MSVSVVISTYNRSELVKRAIKSVQKQTVSVDEIIIVSDASTDNTEQTVNEMMKSDERIQFYTYENSQGVSYARNFGIDQAQGEYIAFLDDDDEWLPEKIQLQLEVFNHSDVGLVYTGVNEIYEEENIQFTISRSKVENAAREMLMNNCVGITSTVMVKKECLKKVGMFDTRLKARVDYDLWLRIAQEYEIEPVKESLVNYYNVLNGDQISTNLAKYQETQEIMEEKYHQLFDSLSHSERKKKEYINLLFMCNKAMKNGDKKQAIAYAKEAFRLKKTAKSLFVLVFSRFDYRVTLKVRAFM